MTGIPLGRTVEERSAPDLTDHVVGFRSWMLPVEAGTPLSAGGGFSAINKIRGIGGGWEPGDCEAVCSVHVTHDPPAKGCGCGFYAYHDLVCFEERGTYGDVFGAVVGWGRMMATRDGWRAQYARVIAFSAGPDVLTDMDVGEGSEWMDRLRQLAEAFEVEVVPFQDLEEYAEQFGDPIPQALRPGRRKKRLPGKDRPKERGLQSGAAAAPVSMPETGPVGGLWQSIDTEPGWHLAAFFVAAASGIGALVCAIGLLQRFSVGVLVATVVQLMVLYWIARWLL